MGKYAAFIYNITLCCTTFSYIIIRQSSTQVFAERDISTGGFEVVADSGVMYVGEELLYNVSYLFFNLGQVQIKVLEKSERNGRVVYKTIAYIDSYKGIPFVNLHDIFESEMDQQFFSRGFIGKDHSDDVWKYNKYIFQYDSNRVFVEKGEYKTRHIEEVDTLEITTPYQDGLSLFFYARGQFQRPRRDTIPTLIYDKKAHTIIEFTDEVSDEEIDPVNYPVAVRKLEGEADFIGIFGLTGAFRGWFSDDAARVPIIAKMKVIIGSVKVELRSWKREGWAPPRYEEKQ